MERRYCDGWCDKFVDETFVAVGEKLYCSECHHALTTDTETDDLDLEAGWWDDWDWDE